MKFKGIKIPKSKKRFFVGVDPGTAGALGVVDEHGRHVFSSCFKGKTEMDIYDSVSPWLDNKQGETDFVFLEKVGSMPGQGVSSTFKFGLNYGLVRGFIIASKVPWGLVTPSRWQNAMNCRSGGDKSVQLEKAQRLWPEVEMNKTGKRQVYDALLLAEYCRRTRLGIPF